QDYVSLEIAGQDLRDPLLTSGSYCYKDFSAYELFVGSPDLDDVNQGYLGDCYYLASLASLALSDGDVISQMATDLGDGTYAVRFYDDGREVYVRVDGQLPVYSLSSNNLVYARQGPDGEIWAPIVEKAYAYYHKGLNSYNSLTSGWMATASWEITGADSQQYYLPHFSVDPSALWEILESHIEAGHGLTLGTWASPQVPLVGGHGYVVESVESVEGRLFVTVFNPWGVDGCSWDDNYDDGLVTISIDQVVSDFSHLVACLA
ncbi:MAG: hypothetical protein J7M14_00620, partial [Planctomycetes bacterium]|nr:hypothetical protein [Planctomycetota bacterium]